MSPLLQLTLARFREFYREPAAVFWVYGFPLILAVALGVAFRDRPVEKIAIDVVTDSAAGSPAADALVAKLEADKRITVTRSDLAAARTRLRTAKTGLVITPAGTAWQYTIDPNRPDCALARSAAENVLLRGLVPTLPPQPADEEMTEAGGRYIDFLMPGLIGLNLMGGGLFGVGFVVVDMRMRKLLKRYLATPMRKSDFLLSLMISRMLFTLTEIAVLLTFAYFAFDIRVTGNVLALVTIIVLGATAFAGLGLLIASRAKTIETVSGLMNAIMLPMYVLSGVFFPAERFPAVMQPFIQLLPLTAVNDALRAVMNEGKGFEAVAVPAAILAAWGGVSFAVALRVFRWR